MPSDHAEGRLCPGGYSLGRGLSIVGVGVGIGNPTQVCKLIL
jgi:hypothetical protein